MNRKTQLKPKMGPDISPGQASELIALRKFRADIGVVPSTCWRWIKKGWLPQPINLGGRLYLTRGQVAEFNRRATAGDFASFNKPPTRTV